MRWVSAFQNALQFSDKPLEHASPLRGTFEEAITAQAVHEFLFDPKSTTAQPLFPALRAIEPFFVGATDMSPLEKRIAAQDQSLPTLIWIDAACTFYPPAAIALGIHPAQLHIIRPHPKDLVWAATECLRCTGVAAVIAPINQPLTRVEVRRLQLAAEKGGGVGLLIRPNTAKANSHIYAAATRWLVSPAPGERTIQRWRLQLVHGHGRHIGQTFLLEKNRATGHTHFVPLSAALVDYAKVSSVS